MSSFSLRSQTFLEDNYTFLRIVVFISNCLIAIESYAQDDKINFGVILFAIIALLFNPICPIYLRDKEV